MADNLAGAALADALWAKTHSHASDFAPLSGNRRVDVAVIGGGFTGLSTALHLATAGVSVTLLEAEVPGFGASGRNTGEVVPGWSKHSPDDILREFGAERGERMNQWVQESARLVFELIQRHDIACDAVQRGWLMPASNPARLAAARAKHDQWAGRGANVEFLDRERTVALTGSEHYLGAWLHRDGGTLHPLAYARGLAEAATTAGAAIHGHSPAVAIEAGVAGGYQVRTPDGSLECEQVVLATNAYADRLWPDLARAFVPLRLFQTATAPLGDNVARSILPEGHGISDSQRVLWAFRKDAEGRVVTGVTPLTVWASHAHMRSMATHQLRTVFPQVGEPQIDHFWNGVVAVTLDRLPRFATLASGIHAGFGYSGRGIAMATGMGKVLAERVMGTPADALALPQTPLGKVPVQRLAVPIARLRAWLWRMQDRWEDRN